MRLTATSPDLLVSAVFRQRHSSASRSRTLEKR